MYPIAVHKHEGTLRMQWGGRRRLWTYDYLFFSSKMEVQPSHLCEELAKIPDPQSHWSDFGMLLGGPQVRTSLKRHVSYMTCSP